MIEKQKPLKILVSHPVRQHAHQLCYGLQEQGWLQKFITSVWYKPNDWLIGNLVKVFGKVNPALAGQVRKRYFEPLQEELVEMYPVPELFRIFLQGIFKPKQDFKWLFEVEKWHDRYVSRRIRQLNPDIFIGFEHGSLKSFKTAKKLGKITVLDLAQVHHSRIAELREQFPELKESILADDAFFNKTNQIKTERLHYVDYIFTLSEMAKKSLTQAGFDEKKIFLLYLGFDPKNFQQKEIYPKSGTFRILYVGAIVPSKGIGLLLEAVKNLKLPDLEVNLVGSVAMGGEALLKNHENLFTHHPYKQPSELKQLYQEADVFILPSYLDSWSMVVIEAMACGTPVILTDTTGTQEIVRQGGGFVIPAGNQSTLEEKILFFYQNREEIEKMGRKAYDSVQQLTWQHYRLQLKKAVETIISTDKYQNRSSF